MDYIMFVAYAPDTQGCHKSQNCDLYVYMIEYAADVRLNAVHLHTSLTSWYLRDTRTKLGVVSRTRYLPLWASVSSGNVTKLVKHDVYDGQFTRFVIEIGLEVCITVCEGVTIKGWSSSRVAGLQWWSFTCTWTQHHAYGVKESFKQRYLPRNSESDNKKM